MAPRREASAHPPLRRLADRLDGTLSPARSAALDAHLAAGCTLCEERLGSLRGVLSAMRAGPLPAPPTRLRRAASRLHAEARLRAAFERARSVVARLVFDGRAAPAFALRAAPGDERRLLWDAGGYEIDACVVVAARSADVLGQVVPADERGRDVVVLQLSARSGSRIRVANTAAGGRFAFRGLAPGLWTIEGRVDGSAFATPPFLVESGN